MCIPHHVLRLRAGVSRFFRRSLLRAEPLLWGRGDFYKVSLCLVVKAHQQNDPNVVSFQMAMGEYLAQNEAFTLERVVAEISQQPLGVEILVTRDFNVDISALDGHKRDESIFAVIVKSGLEDMAAHFLPLHLPWIRDVRTCIVLCCRQGVQSWTNCILRTEHRPFQKISVQEPRHNMDSYLILGFLLGATLKGNQLYLGNHVCILLHPHRRSSR